jgi:hypothetical protein
MIMQKTLVSLSPQEAPNRWIDLPGILNKFDSTRMNPF